jgi:hypothetical protein
MAVPLDRPTASHAPNASLRQWWSIVTTLLAAALFVQAVFAGAMLSGVDWARAAHGATALIIVALTLTTGLVSAVTLRHVAHGPKLGLTLLSLAVVAFLQMVVGKSSAAGANLMWLHVPLGVALVGFAALAVANARRLGGKT